MKMIFSSEDYKRYYKLDVDNVITKTELFNNWLQNINENRICYKIKVPSKFNYNEYIKINQITMPLDEAYLHWYKNCKNNYYLQNEGNGEKNTYAFKDFKILPEDLIQSNMILLKFIKKTDKDDINNILDEFKNFTDKKPYINISNSLQYFTNL